MNFLNKGDTWNKFSSVWCLEQQLNDDDDDDDRFICQNLNNFIDINKFSIEIK